MLIQTGWRGEGQGKRFGQNERVISRLSRADRHLRDGGGQRINPLQNLRVPPI